MRIPSGTTDQYVYFVAVDATDFTTRETGLSSFTVYRSRNGAAAAAMTTPTINETDSSNMPGVYELLLDEDMTIDAGDDSQEMVLHITHSGMAPVSRTIELYRPKITAGETLTVSSSRANVDVIAISGDTTAADNCESFFDGTGYAGTNNVIPSVTTVTGNVNGSVTSVSGAVGSVTGTVGGVAGTITTLDALDTAQDTQHSTTQSAISGLNDVSTAAVADAVWEEAIADHSGTSGSVAESLNAAGGAGDPWTTSLPGSYTGTQAGKILADVLADTGELQTNQGNWLTATGFSTHSAADVWTVATRVVTAATNITSDGAAINTTSGVVDRVTLTDTTTTNTDMRGTDSANTVVPDAAGTALTIIGTAGAALTDLGGMSTALKAEVQAECVDALQEAIPDSVPSDGTIPSMQQAAYMIVQFLTEFAVSGTTYTVKKVDGSTSLMTFTLDDGTSPTSITRAT